MHKRFQIIKPFLSDKIVEAATLKKGAKQCYKEVKASKVDSFEFAIKDIDSKEIFRYKINRTQIGGAEDGIAVKAPEDDVETKAPEIEPTIKVPDVTTDHDIAKIAIMLAELVTKVTSLEKDIDVIKSQHLNMQHLAVQQQITATNVYDANVEKLKTLRTLQDAEKADDICSIM